MTLISFQDDINGAQVERSEQRDGLKLTGEYSYSDGFFKRTGEFRLEIIFQGLSRFSHLHFKIRYLEEIGITVFQFTEAFPVLCHFRLQFYPTLN